MGTINVFNHVTIDGFFAGPGGEIDWFKSIEKADDFDAFTHEQSKSGDGLLFGRTTYEMMKSYWPTPAALENDPDMAKIMDNSPKFVVSRSLRSVEEGPNWKNVHLLPGIERDEIVKLKEKGDLTILGSGTVVKQLAELGLIDEYLLIVVPVVLGAGKSMFADVGTMDLTLQESRQFKNGIVALNYKPG
jgi:dihydrofolate reductase